MRNNSYDSEKYRKGQAIKTAFAWERGVYDHLRTQPVSRRCSRDECRNTFEIKGRARKKYCSRRCAATVNNPLRGPLSPETRAKIAVAIRKRRILHPLKGKIIVPRLVRDCKNCGKVFETPRWQNHIYCSVHCSIHDIGSRPTSPRAARAKAGIRLDINPTMYFFSRWEANFARLMNFRGVVWKFQPKTFLLKTQRYTPDFYLPETNEYIEIKNYLSEYSRNRDHEFRECFPSIKLRLVLKADYLKLQEEFAPLINEWEFGTMPSRKGGSDSGNSIAL